MASVESEKRLHKSSFSSLFVNVQWTYMGRRHDIVKTYTKGKVLRVQQGKTLPDNENLI